MPRSPGSGADRRVLSITFSPNGDQYIRRSDFPLGPDGLPDLPLRVLEDDENVPPRPEEELADLERTDPQSLTARPTAPWTGSPWSAGAAGWR